MTTLSRSLRSPSRFPPFAPFLRTTGRQQNSLTLILFSPRKPRFHRRCAPLKVSLWRRMSADATVIFILTGTTTGNRLRLTRFLSVNPSFVAAFAALRVSFPGACPGKDGSLILTKRQHPHGAKLARMFSLRATLSFSRCVFAGRKRIYYKKVHGAALAKVNLLKKCTALLWQK